VFRKDPNLFLQHARTPVVVTGTGKEDAMTKLTYALAAVAALSIAAPTIARAQGVGVYVGSGHGYYGDRYDGPRIGVYREHDRGVVIRGHDWDDD
jgi:hypothetical protein